MDTKCDSLQQGTRRRGVIGLFTGALIYYFYSKNVDLEVYFDSQRAGLDVRR
jgi:hypothetical protein